MTPPLHNLGDLATDEFGIDPADVARAALEAERTGERIGDVMVRLGILDRNEIEVLADLQASRRTSSTIKKARATQSMLVTAQSAIANTNPRGK